jgi:MFS family permease
MHPPGLDRAVLGIVAGNVLTLAIAFWQRWPVTLLLWPFFIQSVVIGRYAYKRMLALRRFTTEGMRNGGRPVEPTEEGKRGMAEGFVMLYGLFHAGYFVFLLVLSFIPEYGRAPTALDCALIAACGYAFWLAHRDSHRRNLAADLEGERHLGHVMLLPFARVLPMQFTICLGLAFGGVGAMLVFGVLKLAADVVMHVVEHRWLRGAAQRSGR